MFYVVLIYILFSVLLVLKKPINARTLLFLTMTLGFCISVLGLSVYITQINWSLGGDNPLFNDVEILIWKANYFLDLDVFDQYRLMNIGTALYIYSSIIFAMNHCKKLSLKQFILLGILPGSLVILYDPAILKAIYGIERSVAYRPDIVEIDKKVGYMNLFYNMIIKGYLVTAMYYMTYMIRRKPLIVRKKYQYILGGLIPLNILFILLFFRFPNHQILFKRYEQLYIFNMEYNVLVYRTITAFSLIACISMCYGLFKYNIFESTRRKNKIVFQHQFETAHVGMKLFTHSIKNQFVAVRLLAEQLGRVDETSSPDMIKKIEGICEDAINRLGKLSSISKKIDLNYQVMDLENVILSKVENMGLKQVNLIPYCGLVMSIDKTQFEKVIENILINSIEASRKNQFIEIIMEETWDYGVIEIKDNGDGIKPQNLKKVLKPFYSTKSTVQNWGIGLTYCQHVLHAFGGEIEISSEVNKGTKVTLYIPKTRSDNYDKMYDSRRFSTIKRSL